jgi:hypothetical protein
MCIILHCHHTLPLLNYLMRTAMTRNWRRCFHSRYNKQQPSNPKFHLNSTQHIQKANLTRRGWVVDVRDRCCHCSVIGEEVEGGKGVSKYFTSIKSTVPTKILFTSLLLRLRFKPQFSHTESCSSDAVSAGWSEFLIIKYTAVHRHRNHETRACVLEYLCLLQKDIRVLFSEECGGMQHSTSVHWLHSGWKNTTVKTKTLVLPNYSQHFLLFRKLASKLYLKKVGTFWK